MSRCSLRFVAVLLLTGAPASADESLDQRQAREQDFTAHAQDLLAKAKDTILHAQKPADLDTLLAQLQAETNPPPNADNPAGQQLAEKINLTHQFALQWQSYLSASTTGNSEEAHQALRQLLSSPQFDSLQIFPRSQLLALRDGGGSAAPAGPNQSPSANGPGQTGDIDAIDAILEKIVRIDQLEDSLNKVARIPHPHWDFSNLFNLDKERLDALAGLPFNIDFKAAMNGVVQGSDVSRVVALELLGTLPFYFNTQASDPPKPDETVDAYLDRMIQSGNDTGNLGLLQRALSVKVALSARPERPSTTLETTEFNPTQHFLAGLSQEEASQFVQAVISYQKSLEDFDRFLPLKIVGERLRTIKAAHPDDYAQAMLQINTPPIDPRMMRYALQGRMFPPVQPLLPDPVLPIPETVSVPARTPASPGKTQ